MSRVLGSQALLPSSAARPLPPPMRMASPTPRLVPVSLPLHVCGPFFRLLFTSHIDISFRPLFVPSLSSPRAGRVRIGHCQVRAVRRHRRRRVRMLNDNLSHSPVLRSTDPPARCPSPPPFSRPPRFPNPSSLPPPKPKQATTSP